MELVFAEDDDGAGGLVGGFEGLFEAEAAFSQFDTQAGAAEFASQGQGGGIDASERGFILGVAQRRDERWSVLLLRGFQGLEGKNEPVFAHGKADAGGFGAADGLAQAVIAAAAEQGVLGAQAAVGELEGGAGVVVEAADQAVIAGIGNAGGVEGGRTAAKWDFEASSSESAISGRASMMGWSAGTLQSSTRRGLVTARRWQSSHIWAATGIESGAESLVDSADRRRSRRS